MKFFHCLIYLHFDKDQNSAFSAKMKFDFEVENIYILLLPIKIIIISFASFSMIFLYFLIGI